MTTSYAIPPGYAMIMSTVSEDELLNPGDVDELADRYGIRLNLWRVAWRRCWMNCNYY